MLKKILKMFSLIFWANFFLKEIDEKITASILNKYPIFKFLNDPKEVVIQVLFIYSNISLLMPRKNNNFKNVPLIFAAVRIRC
jgi:hypothetical protein